MRFREIRTKKRAVRAWLRTLLLEAKRTGRLVVPSYGPTEVTTRDSAFPVYSPTNRKAKRQRCKAGRRVHLPAVKI